MEAIVGLLIAVLLSAVISGFIIWVVSKFNLGLQVDSFGWAMLAGMLYGALNSVVMLLIPDTNGIVRFIVNLIVSAAVLFACGALLKGLTVRGFAGALLAAVSIAVVSFLLLVVVLGGLIAIGQAGNT